jgi:hypothetical protein
VLGMRAYPECALEIKEYEAYRAVFIAGEEGINIEGRDCARVTLLMFKVDADTASKEGGYEGLRCLGHYVPVEILYTKLLSQANRDTPCINHEPSSGTTPPRRP